MKNKRFILLGLVLLIVLLGVGTFIYDKIKTKKEQSIIRASTQGDLSIVKATRYIGIDVNATDGEGWTALMRASYNGHREIVKTLLAKGADVNTKGNNGYTALILASNRGYSDIVTLLLAKGADVNAKDEYGQTPLLAASSYGGYVDYIVAHMKTDKEIDYSMVLSSYKQQLITVQLLLNKGADVNVMNYCGYTPLMAASGTGHSEIVKILLDRGADVNAKDKDGLTALMYSYLVIRRIMGSITEEGIASPERIVELYLRALSSSLRNNGVNINGKTITIVPGSLEELKEIVSSHWTSQPTLIVEMLLNKGADVNAKTNAGVTTLMVACQNVFLKIATMLEKYLYIINVEKLIAKGADVNAKTNAGVTALMLASQAGGYSEIIKILLAKGADVNAKDDNGKTAIYAAKINGYKDAVQLLKNAGAKE